jgi:hypothetical protein
VIAMSMLLVIINDLYVRRPGRSVSPFKANPPLIIDADAVLAFGDEETRGQTERFLRHIPRHRAMGNPETFRLSPVSHEVSSFDQNGAGLPPQRVMAWIRAFAKRFAESSESKYM